MMEKIFIYFLLAAAAYMLGLHYARKTQIKKGVQARLGVEVRKELKDALFFNMLRGAIQYFVKKIEGIELQRYRDLTQQRIAMSGLNNNLSVNEFWAFQLIMGIFVLIMGWSFLFLFQKMPDSSLGSVVYSFIFILFGIAYPWLWIQGLIKKRHQEISYALGPTVDLISLSVEAGLDFIAAITRIVEKSHVSPLSEELDAMAQEIKMGASRAQALRNMATRINYPSISSFVAVLIQADRLGSSIGPVLKAQAAKMRTDRFQQAEKMGAAASQKILFPLVFFIIPSVFIVIFAPLIIRFLTGGLGGSF